MYLDLVQKRVKTKKMILFAIICMFLGYNHFKPIRSYNLSILEKADDNNVDIIDLSNELLPKTEYEKIKCRKSANILNVSFNYYCVHELNDYISKVIWDNGVWDGVHVANYISYLLKNPNMFAIDIGAQLGTFSLYAAATGTKVITVEPFYDNIIRIHKSATSSNFQDQIVLVTNALSDKRNEIKKMSVNKDNIGGQALRPKVESYNMPFEELRKLSDGKYYVRTALLDDLVPYIPLDKNGEPFKSAIMKIDIEGFEPFAFQKASKFFDAVNIEVIFMEWGRMYGIYQERKKQTDEMLKFLYDRGYIAYDSRSDVALNKSKLSSWPWDIVWKKIKY